MNLQRYTHENIHELIHYLEKNFDYFINTDLEGNNVNGITYDFFERDYELIIGNKTTEYLEKSNVLFEILYEWATIKEQYQDICFINNEEFAKTIQEDFRFDKKTSEYLIEVFEFMEEMLSIEINMTDEEIDIFLDYILE